MVRAKLPEGQFRAAPAKATGKVDCNPGHTHHQTKVVGQVDHQRMSDVRQVHITERTTDLSSASISYDRTTGSTDPAWHQP